MWEKIVVAERKCEMDRNKTGRPAGGYRKAAQRRKRRRIRRMRRLLLVVLCLFFAALVRMELIRGQHPIPPAGETGTKGQASTDREVDLSDLYSRHAILLELGTGRTVGEKDSSARVYPASLTKIMTSLLLLEQAPDLSETTEIEDGMIEKLRERDASLAGFAPGERVTLQDLLYGMLLPSGAECSVAAAQWVDGSEAEFAVRMNERAKELGLEHTHFVNATGLQEEEHYSTVRDLAVLLSQALQQEEFREAFLSARYTSSPTVEHPDGITFYSTLFSAMENAGIEEEGILGGKTGYTAQAGLCLASLLTVEGREYVLVTTGAQGNHYTAPFHVLDAAAVCEKLKLWN